MRIISFSIFLLEIAVSVTNVPSCNWVLTEHFGIQPTDICVAGAAWEGTADSMYKCENGVVKYNLYTLNSGCTGTPIHEAMSFTTDIDCSQSTCTDYVIWAWYFNDPNDCSSYSIQASIPNICVCQGESFQK
eukprot:281719_1